MSTSEEPKKVTLKSSDGETFEIDVAVANHMQTIKHIIEDDCATDTIPVPNVQGKVLSKVIEYCKNHVEFEGDDWKLKAFNTEFLDVELNAIFVIILAANYLCIKGLLDLTCQGVADRIKDKTPEEIRNIFGIENDFTPEEEAEVRKENAWAHE